MTYGIEKIEYKVLKFGGITVSVDSCGEGGMPENSEILLFLESIFGRPMIVDDLSFHVHLKYYKGFRVVELSISQSDKLKVGDYDNILFAKASEMLYIGTASLESKGWHAMSKCVMPEQSITQLFIKAN
jgi:hypothetical protein